MGELARVRCPTAPRWNPSGVSFRNDVISGPGGQQVLLRDPSGNLVELFQPAPR